jgi:hypothetical protein|tara:strand:- start:188 stop:928 length:741 start_codon:yes stop_codon:yes gene_type:complete
MNIKGYFKKIQNKYDDKKSKPKVDDKNDAPKEGLKASIIANEMESHIESTLNFVDKNKDPHEYLKRYIQEPEYRDWFKRNFPNRTIYEAVGLTAMDYLEVKRGLDNESQQEVKEEPSFKPIVKEEPKINFDDFIDERLLVSHNAFGDKEMKIKIIEVSDEIAPLETKFGDRVKVNKVLVTIKHLKTQAVEEAEFDIEAIERELMEKRHYTSTNRWVPTKEIKNGYVANTRHTILITDAASLDYITF